MARQGCINEGPDRRFLGRFVCWLQRRFSYASEKLPRWIIRRTQRFLYWDGVREFVRFGLAWPPYLIWQWIRIEPMTQGSPGKVGMLRFGWRYDVNARRYIFPAAAFKTREDWPMDKGY